MMPAGTTLRTKTAAALLSRPVPVSRLWSSHRRVREHAACGKRSNHAPRPCKYRVLDRRPDRSARRWPAERPAAPGAAASIVTRYFGYEVTGDLNADGREDIAFPAHARARRQRHVLLSRRGARSADAPRRLASGADRRSHRAADNRASTERHRRGELCRPCAGRKLRDCAVGREQPVAQARSGNAAVRRARARFRRRSRPELHGRSA